jgi:hypothetical protein
MGESKGGSGRVGKAQEMRIERAEIKRELSQASSARKRLDVLISHPKGAAIIATLPAQDLFLTIKETGLSDSVELVRLASPDQFRTFVDLDAWKGEELDSSKVLAWLRAAATDEDEERFRKKIHRLDVEVLEMVLRSSCKVHDLEEDPDPEFEGIPFRSPEGHFLVEFLVEGAEYAGARRLLDELYAEDPLRTARLLEAVRWELPSELAETALRWRSGRMQDLGFPDLGEAMSYFAYVDPAAALPALKKAPAVPDSFLLAKIDPHRGFFDDAAALVQEHDHDVLERQLVSVFNAVMVVEALDPSDLGEVQQALDAARGTLSLGLEELAKGDPAAAAELLVTAPIKRIFQVGASLGLKLKFRADRLMKSGKASLPGGQGEPLLDRPLGAVIAALRQKRPQFAVALDDTAAPDDKTRPLCDRTDLARLDAALAEAERIAEVMEALGFDAQVASLAAQSVRPATQIHDLRFSDYFLSALAHQLVGDSFAFTAIRAAEVGPFAEKAFALKGGRPVIAAAARDVASARIFDAGRALSADHEQAAARFVDAALKRLLDELGAPWALGTLDAQGPLPLLVSQPG